LQNFYKSYANANKEKASEAAVKHYTEPAFLGHTKSQSDRWSAEIQNGQTEKDRKQLRIFWQFLRYDE